MKLFDLEGLNGVEQEAVKQFVTLLRGRTSANFDGETRIELFHKGGRLDGMNVAGRQTLIKNGRRI